MILSILVELERKTLRIFTGLNKRSERILMNIWITIIAQKNRQMKENIIEGGLAGAENLTLDKGSIDQVDFELLTTENRIFQILKAKGEPMHITEIISALNHQLLNSNSTEVYQNAHWDLSADDRFKWNDNIGYYELAEWNLGQETVSDVVENGIHKPSMTDTYLEIINKIKKERPQSDEKTINGLINIICLGFKNRQ